jgi:RNA polymerase sigma factor (sigma-70 family)
MMKAPAGRCPLYRVDNRFAKLSPMATEQLHTLLRQLRRLAVSRESSGLSDVQLLERFVATRDEAAFEVLVWRHGPMVLSMCRRVLRHEQDAEDSFQATFLALARKAGSIGKRQALASWLYKVAFRIALEAKRGRQKQCTRDRIAAGPPMDGLVDEVIARDVAHRVDEEVNRLPERYRAPVILCYFEGKTYDEAARILGCPRGTVGIRLMRARERLRSRLTRRGLTLSSGVLATVLAPTHLNAAPALLVSNTVRVASGLTRVATAANAASPSVAALAEGVLKAMFITKLKVIAAVVLVGAVGTGAGLTSYRGLATGDASAGEITSAPTSDQSKDERVKQEIRRLEEQLEQVKRELARLEATFRSTEVPSPSEGTILFVGTDMKEGEQVPADRIVSIKIDGELKKYRQLRPGDLVSKGQLLAQLDDRLARADKAIKDAKVGVANAELAAAEKTKDEAFLRYNTQQRLWNSERGRVTSEEELRGAKLLWQKSSYDSESKAQAVNQAKLEAKSAQTVLELHEIRSSVKGVIKNIHKGPGEAVRYLEPVFVIRVLED